MSTTDQFNIRWNNYTSVLQNVFRKLLEGEQFVDVTLACEGQSIKCHRLILSACSTYFDRILTEIPTPNLVIYLKDLKFWELKALVTFMYNGEVSISQQKLPYLCKAAEALKIKGLANDAGIVDGDLDELMDDDEDDMEEVEDLRHDHNPHHNHRPIQQPKSLLKQPPQQHHANLSAFAAAAAAAAANRQQAQVKRKIVSQPPKLVKMQRMEQRINGNGNGTTKSQIQGLTKNMVVKKQEQGKASPPSGKKEVVKEKVKDEEEENSNDGGIESSIKEDEGANVDQDENEDAECGEENDSVGSEGDESQEGSNGNATGRQASSKVQMKYGKEIKDSALNALQSGMTVKQCSETYGVPRKTISKWKSRDAITSASATTTAVKKDNGDREEGEGPPTKPQSGKQDSSPIPSTTTTTATTVTGTPIILPPKTAMGAPVDSADRAERLKKATELALSGVTVRQAAAHYEIPRTTLCAYMKRRGLTSKRNYCNNKRGSGAGSGGNGTTSMAMAGKSESNSNGDATSNGQSGGTTSSHYEDFPFLGISEMMDDLNQGNYDADAYQDAEEEYEEK